MTGFRTEFIHFLVQFRRSFANTLSMTDFPQSREPAPPDPQAEREAAFMRLLLTHERAVLRFILTLLPSLADARDVLQETAVALWAKRAEYDPAREFLPWACGFARMKVRELWRKQPRWEAFADEDLVELIEARRGALRPELSDREARLQDCVEKLPPPQRAVLAGYYLEGDTVETLAERDGKTVDAIYKLLQRVRRALLDCVERGMEAS